MIGFQVGSYQAVSDFETSKKLADQNQPITPDQINIEDYASDYDKVYRRHQQVNHDMIWTATPIPSFPWMEAFLGCEIKGTGSSFWAASPIDTLDELSEVTFARNGEWFQAFKEFLDELISLSEGKYPVGQPILRGPTDLLGALLGESEFVVQLAKDPDKLKKTIRFLGESFSEVVQFIQDRVPDFHGGRSIGSVYSLWAPGKCLYLQEDLSALLSPDLYRRHFLEVDTEIAKTYEYSLFHLHPSSSFIFEDILGIEPLQVVEVNRDLGESGDLDSVIPFFRKVLEKKRLQIRGRLTQEEIDLLLDSLPYSGLYIQIVIDSIEEANELFEYMKKKCSKQR